MNNISATGLLLLLAALSGCVAPGRGVEKELRGPAYEVLKEIQRELISLKHKYPQLEGIEQACIGRSITHCSCRWNGSPKTEHWQVRIRLLEGGGSECEIASLPPSDGGIEMQFEDGLVMCWFGVKEYDPLLSDFFRNMLQLVTKTHQLRLLKKHDSLQE